MTPLDLCPTAPPTTTPAGQRILDAAAELFYRRGINRTGVDLIALEADVTKRTLYQRFGSKEGLVASYLQRRAHIWQSGLLDVLPRNDDGPGALAALYLFVESWVQHSERGCGFVNAWVEVSAQEHPALKVIQEEKAWMRQLFRHIADDAPTAEALYLLYEGAQISAALQQSVEPLRCAAQASQRLLRP